jgi:phage replication-related protein YjqB (UPF0714/DUF867 family)
MADKYGSFSDLENSEREGVDFRVRLCHRSSTVAIIAPHGGRIEKGTSEIAEAIAGEGYNLYCFEGMKPQRNWALHITSTRFNEPRCVDLVSACDVVVAVHGCKGADRTIYMGGLDDDLREAIRERLRRAGFATDSRPSLLGIGPDNICNRGRRRRGVQLEISKALRTALLEAGPTERAWTLPGLADAVCHAIDERATR